MNNYAQNWVRLGSLVWNLWDRDCVVIHRQRGVLRVGSDDAENLAGFLKGKMGAV